MSRFSKNGGREMPEMNTSSLPDLIFTILFFFMIVTTMREVTLNVKFTTPKGTELEKLEKKSAVPFIYVGPPTDQLRAKFGSKTRMQLQDKYAEPSAIKDFIAMERKRVAASNGGDETKQTISMKIDKDTKMSFLNAIKKELRNSWALKINYSAGSRGE